jgi:hypothetical protein
MAINVEEIAGTFDELSEKQKVAIVRQWCDEQKEQGLDVCLDWDGGNDSGCVSWAGESTENIITDYIIDRVYDILDYGSWAGDFYAQGTMSYDEKEKAFVGEDHYSESEYTNINPEVFLNIPSKFYFEQIDYSVTDDDYRECVEVNFVIHVANGFIDPELEEWVKRQETILETVIKERLNDLTFIETDYQGMDSSGSIRREEFTETEDGLLSGALDISYREDIGSSKDVMLNLNEEDYED